VHRATSVARQECRLWEQALKDVIANLEIVDRAMDRIFEIFAAIVNRTFIYLSADPRTQHSPIMRPNRSGIRTSPACAA